MASFSDSPFRNIHGDVLKAKPSTEEGKTQLVEEIKRRGKLACAAESWPEAEALYSKAIDVLPSAPLYGNRSLVRFNYGKFKDSLDDATKAIELDAAYSKGFYRKGQACTKLGKHIDAHKAFEDGLKIEPGNKPMKKLCETARKTVDDAIAKGATAESMELSSGLDGMNLDPSPPMSTSPPPSTNTKKTTPKKKSKSDTAKCEEDAELKKEEIRGYRTLADGRKTTYFNRELSDKDKALIGDIAPKKIDPSQAGGADAAAAAVSNAPVRLAPDGGAGGGGASAWNVGGTWEEKDRTEWAKSRITSLLSAVALPLPEQASLPTAGILMGKAQAKITSVSEIEGEAHEAFSRGKWRYLYDFSHLSMDWELSVTGMGIPGGILDGTGSIGDNLANMSKEEMMAEIGKEKTKVVKGRFIVEEVSNDTLGEYEIRVEVKSKASADFQPLVDRYIKSKASSGSGGNLQSMLFGALSDFHDEYTKPANPSPVKSA